MIHYIYKIIFLKGSPTNRYYLGKRSYKGKNIINDKYHGSGVFCKLYFKKYKAILGETYIKEIIEVNESFGINRNREAFIVGDKWKTDPLCMNQCPGGVCDKNPINRKLTKDIIQYDLFGNYISCFESISEASQITGINLSSISSTCRKESSTAGGYIWRFKSSPLTKGELFTINLRIVPIKQYDLNLNYIKTWDCAKDIERTLNICCSSILEVCHKTLPRRYTAGGYIWSFYNEDPIPKSDSFFGYVKVAQYDINGNFIALYNSYKEAADAIGAKWQSIQRVCNGKRKTTKGFVWKKYYENYKYNRRVVS